MLLESDPLHLGQVYYLLVRFSLCSGRYSILVLFFVSQLLLNVVVKGYLSSDHALRESEAAFGLIYPSLYHVLHLSLDLVLLFKFLHKFVHLGLRTRLIVNLANLDSLYDDLGSQSRFAFHCSFQS